MYFKPPICFSPLSPRQWQTSPVGAGTISINSPSKHSITTGKYLPSPSILQFELRCLSISNRSSLLTVSDHIMYSVSWKRALCRARYQFRSLIIYTKQLSFLLHYSTSLTLPITPQLHPYYSPITPQLHPYYTPITPPITPQLRSRLVSHSVKKRERKNLRKSQIQIASQWVRFWR